MIIHKMNRVSGFIIIITGAIVRISEYHIILDILIKSLYTAVRNLNTAVYRGTKFSAVPNTTIRVWGIGCPKKSKFLKIQWGARYKVSLC